MATIFLVCAGLGGTVMVLQLLAGMAGLIDSDTDVDHGGDVDTDHDHGHAHSHAADWFFGVLSVRTVTAALLFFGLGGMTARYYQAGEPAQVAAAVFAGLTALYGVAAIMKQLSNLKADGTIRIANTIGADAVVYLRVPGSKSGPGKVMVSIANRAIEYQAVTAGPDLPSGANVKVVAVVGPDTVEVIAA